MIEVLATCETTLRNGSRPRLADDENSKLARTMWSNLGSHASVHQRQISLPKPAESMPLSL